jgi:hypothetical protein
VAALIKFDNTVALGIINVIRKDGGACRVDVARWQQLWKPVTVEDVVAKDER